MRTAYHEQLDALNNQLAEMCRMAGVAMERATQALLQADLVLAEQHAVHFAGEEPCHACGEKHLPKESPHDLRLQTEDGEVRLREPAFHCPPCERDFFPSTHPVAD